MKRLLLLAPFAAAEQLLAPASYVMLTPLALSHGAIYYSHWISAIAFSAISQFLSAGYTAVQVRERSVGSGSPCTSLSMDEAETTALWILIACVGIALLAAVTGEFWSPFGSISYWGIGLMIAAISELDKFVTADLRSKQKYRTTFTLEFVGRIIWAAAFFVGMLLNFVEPISLVAVSFLLRLAAKLAIITVRNEHSWLLRAITNVYKFSVRGLLRRSGWIFGQVIGGSAITIADRFLVSQLFGAVFFAAYFPAYQLSSLCFNLSASSATVLLSMREKEIATILHWKRLAATTAFASLPNFALYLLGPEIIHLWLPHQFASISYTMFFFVNTSFMLLAMLSPFHFILLRAQRDRAVSIANNTSGIVYLIGIALTWGRNEQAILVLRMLPPIVQFIFYFSSLSKLSGVASRRAV